MLGRRRKAELHDDDPNVIVENGPSLAKGPALVVGSILVAFGLAGLLKNANFPDFSAGFPDGTANGSSFLGIEVNGWTKLGLAIAGGAMLLNALMPRKTRRRHIDELRGASAGYDRDRDVDVHRERTMGRERDLDRDGIADRDERTMPVGSRDLNRTDDRTDDETIVERGEQRGERFGRPVETTSRFGRPAADQDLAATDADRIAPTERDRSGAVSPDDDVTRRR